MQLGNGLGIMRQGGGGRGGGPGLGDTLTRKPEPGRWKTILARP